MSGVKERIFGAVTIMSDEDAQKVWDLIRTTFALANMEEDEPTDDERAAILAYRSGADDYQPTVSHEDLKKELGL